MATVLILSQYRYDPLDRLVACAPTNLAPHQRFYCKSRLATEIQGAVAHTFFLSDNVPLAQQRRQGAGRETNLLATDQQGSVLQALDRAQHQAMVYSPYGHRAPANGLSSLLGFNGERAEPVTGHYLLGNGYRAFNPVLMRFNSPDSLSPFDKGGMNAYAYCVGEPVNNVDPTGHIKFRKMFEIFGQYPKKRITYSIQGVEVKLYKEHAPDFFNDPTPVYKGIDETLYDRTSEGVSKMLPRDRELISLNAEVVEAERALADRISFEGNTIGRINGYPQWVRSIENKRLEYKKEYDLLQAELKKHLFEPVPRFESPKEQVGKIRSGKKKWETFED
ncbi:RHS repeat-associated core domain [Pseudomonas asplenii]|uniref:RHS repeat-associated core domain n=1 Tax=Pseudomonas asplenii TaxID=53407 RepID=A0A0M9GGL2_9PSED|nr:RHS repeat-associated core domain-containing protein [Pseudomonas fuscovaginae]KPA90691.1 RHS repeat-associated core domain [Pseudomonas fuscovaginae]